MSTLVGRLIKPAQEPRVNLDSFCTKPSAPSIPDKTNSKSDNNGGSRLAKSDSAVISFKA